MELSQILNRCWSSRPQDRPSAKELSQLCERIYLQSSLGHHSQEGEEGGATIPKSAESVKRAPEQIKAAEDPVLPSMKRVRSPTGDYMNWGPNVDPFSISYNSSRPSETTTPSMN